VLASCFSVLSLVNLVNDLLRLDIGGFTWRGLFGPVIYAAIAAVFYWLWAKTESKGNSPFSETSR
jgi:hypothetical protein